MLSLRRTCEFSDSSPILWIKKLRLKKEAANINANRDDVND